MLKLIIFISWLGLGGSTPDQPYWEAHNKKASKELIKWSKSFKNAEHIKTIEGREFYKLTSNTGLELGTMVLSSAKGRFDRFDLMTVLSSDGHVRLIRILKYRSEYGSEITNKKWLSQFYNKPEDHYIFRKNIDAVSGATFSSQGLIEEINQVLKVFSQLNKDV